MSQWFRKLVAVAFVAAGLIAESSLAQSFPSKPIRIVGAIPAGTPLDSLVRLVGLKLSERLGVPVIMDNKPGGDGVVAINLAANAPADGHTILAAVSSMSILPSSKKNLPYDPVKDFLPLTRIINFQNILIANPSTPFSTFPELVAYAKANPGKLDYSTSSRGGLLHLVGELLAKEAGFQWKNIPHSGNMQGLNAVMAGHIPVGLTVVSQAVPLVKGGKLKAIAILGPKRSSALPDVPAIGEVSSLPILDVDGWAGFMVRAGTPKAVADRLHGEIVAILQSPEVREFTLRSGGSPVDETQQAFTKKYLDDMALWAKVFRESKIEVD